MLLMRDRGLGRWVAVEMGDDGEVTRTFDVPEDLATALDRLGEGEDWRGDASNGGGGGEPVAVGRYLPPSLVPMSIAKLATAVFGGWADDDRRVEPGREFSLDVGKRKGTVLVDALIVGIDEQDQSLSLSQSLTPFDRAVFDAVCSQIENERLYFTSRQVCETLWGKGARRDAVDEVSASISRMLKTRVRFDATDHVRAKHPDVESFFYDAPVLDLEGVTIRQSGQTTAGWHVVAVPRLYSYCKAVGQVVTVRQELLDTPVRRSKELICLTRYLARRVEMLKRPNSKMAAKVRYHTMSLNAGWPVTSDKKTLSRRRDYVARILDDFREKGEISGWRTYGSAARIEGVEIDLGRPPGAERSSESETRG